MAPKSLRPYSKYYQFRHLLEAPDDLIGPLLLEHVLRREYVLVLHAVVADLLDDFADPVTAANVPIYNFVDFIELR